MKDETEQQIKKAIADYLRIKKYIVINHRNVGIKKPNGSFIPLPAGEKGISDLLACSPEGRFIAIEVKRPGGTVSPDQREFIERINKKGGLAFVAYSIDDAMAKI